MAYNPVTILPVQYPAPQSAMAVRSLSEINTLIIHHTAGPVNQEPLAIDAEHRNEGWAMIGYNFVIPADGKIYAARPWGFVPSAAYGWNTPSLNVVLCGNFQVGDAGYTGPPTAAQMQSLKDLSVYLHQQFPGIVRTIGHGDVATLFYPQDTADYATACCGSELYTQIPAVKAYTLAAMPKT